MTSNNYSKCPACSCTKKTTLGTTGLHVCKECECLYGNITLGNSYLYVKPYMTTDPTADERAVPYDMTCLSSRGIERRHGFYDKASGLITQVG